MNVSGVMNSSVSQILGRISWTSIAENDAVEIIRCSIAGASEASVRSSCVMNGLNVGDEIDRLRDRLTRFEIRARFGDDRAMWDPSRDWASQGPPEVIINKNQAAVDATPLASSPNKLGNNFRQWRNMHNISDSSSLMNTVIDGNNGQGRHRDEESAESVAQSEDELRDREMNQVHTEQQRPRESLNGGRPLSMDREEIANVEERVEQVAARDFEQGHVTGATSTVRRVAFVNESSAANRNDANRATLGEFGGATPAAFVTAQSQLYQSEILGAGRNDIRRGSGVYEAGDATGGHDEMREGHGLGTGMATGVRGRPNSRESQGVTYGRGGLRERGGSLTRYENSRYGPHVDGWSSMPNSMGGERRNTLSNSAWNGSVGFNSTLAREKNTCELYRQWGLIFRDSGKNNPELFISRLMTCAGRYQLSLDDICRTLPAVLDMEACAWLEREEKEWKTLKDMAEAFRLQYCDEGTQQCLRQEIEARTQGPKEEISVFLLKIRLLLDQLKPPLCMREQIDRAYMNLHPSYRRAFSREQCVTFREFQKLGKLEELKRRQELAYREPPKSENVMFRNAAYVEPEESRSVAAVVIASVEEREKERDNKSDSKQRDKNIKCYRCQKKGHIAARCRTKLKCEKCGVEVTKFRLCNNCWRNRKSDKKDQAEKPEAPAVAVISDRGVSVNEAEMAPEDPAGRLARWHTRLQAFDIEFVHRKGSAHQLADSLSRACEGQIELAVMTTGEDTWYERHLKEVAESPSKFEDLKVQDGKLYALRKKEADELLGDHSDDWKLALPNNERERAIYEAHDVAQAGHLGIDKTYTRVATYYYWPEIFPKQLNMWPGRGKRPREDLTERARTRSVTFRYARRPGMDQNGEFPDGSEDSRPFRLFCRSSTRACYRGGRHICLTVRTRSPVEEVQARGREEPGAVLPGVAAIEPAVEHLAAPDVIDAEEVAGGLAEGGPSTERLARSESSVAMEIEPPAAAEAELAGPGEVEAQDFAWPEIRVRWDEPEPRVDLGALGPIRPGCWNCGAINSGHSHVNCPDPIRRRYCFWCGEPGYSKSTCPRCSPLWQRYLASGKTRSSRPGYYKR
uniref:RNA-directed DNA polymerase n=1 Tax=Trichogramma kaykai TaxID=54128 RepID=A0ABD2WP66_9HYME